MTYALIVNGTIQTIGGLPSAARRLDTGEWVCPLAGSWSPAQIAACGYVQVVGTSRPPDTPTTTFDYSVTLVGGVPTETWTARPKTQAEMDADTAATSRATLTNVTELNARLTRLAAYKTDTEIVAALARANTTVIATQDLNRLLKVMLRRDERQSAAIALLVRLIDPALLSSIADTTDA